MHEIGNPELNSIVSNDICVAFANTKHDLNSIKDQALPITFKYELSVCNENSPHYNTEKCNNFLLNVNSIHQSIYSTVYFSGSSYEYTAEHLSRF